MSNSIQAKQLKASDINEQVGKLAGMKVITPVDMAKVEKAPAIFNMPELLIFSGVQSKKIDEFLLSYKEMGLTPIKLKAVTTPKNIGWTLYQLIRELRSESEQIERQLRH